MAERSLRLWVHHSVPSFGSSDSNSNCQFSPSGHSLFLDLEIGWPLCTALFHHLDVHVHLSILRAVPRGANELAASFVKRPQIPRSDAAQSSSPANETRVAYSRAEILMPKSLDSGLLKIAPNVEGHAHACTRFCFPGKVIRIRQEPMRCKQDVIDLRVKTRADS